MVVRKPSDVEKVLIGTSEEEIVPGWWWCCQHHVGDDDGDVGDDDGDVDDVNVDVDDDTGDDEHKNDHILIPFHFKVTSETSVVPSAQKATIEVWFNICER